MYLKLRYSVFLIVFIFCIPFKNSAQVDPQREKIDESNQNNVAVTDTTFLQDSLNALNTRKSKNSIDTPVMYEAEDSIVSFSNPQRVRLYKNAKVEYGDVVLEADFIEYNQDDNSVFASGVEDSLGNLLGKPKFKDNQGEYLAKTIKYNFKTKEAYILEVFTEEEQGFLHSKETKKLGDNNFLLRDGKYTTCDLEEHPHFYLSMSKAKVIPNDKIVSGFSYLVMEDIPLKFAAIPFGFFPNQSQYSSGIIIPKYGEEKNRGFYLQDGGYYFGISDKMDMQITGDIFSKGSWGSDISFRYVKRYKFSSNFNFSYAEFIKSEEGLSDYQKSKDMRIQWTHSQDAKANPNNTFSASVNYSTSSYDQFNSKSLDQRNTNTKSSSISFGRKFPDSPFRLKMDLKHTQNSNTHNIALTLPVMTFNMDRQYPFRRKNSSGDAKWYEDIEIQYSSKLENRIQTTDTLLFKSEYKDDYVTGIKWSDYENGFQHNIPLSTNFKILKYFNLSPRVQYTGLLYPNYIKNRYIDYNLYDSTKDEYGVLVEEEADAFKYAQLVEPSVSLGVGPNIYGMFQMKNPNSKLVAVRHVITPSVSVSYRPDMGSMVEQYYGEYKEYQNGKVYTREYSIFENELYSFPSAPGESGSVSFGLNNNLEMKVRDSEDTTGTGTKKIKLLESLKISTSYNMFADSLNWSVFSISGRTSMFENKLNFQLNAKVDPYALNESGTNEINQFQWNTKEGGIGRLTRFDFSIDVKLNSKEGEENSGANRPPAAGFVDDRFSGAKQEFLDAQEQILTYVDFEIPWNLSANFKYAYNKPGFESSKKITQTLSLSGNVSLTKKWKVSFRTSYDLVENALSSTSINIHRDLHCWEASFSWIPIGYMQNYNFQINVKGSTLRDFLKYNKRKSWQDNL